MNIKKQVDEIFKEYRDSDAIREFKEELAGNMSDKVAALQKKGFDEKSAIEKTLAELGDVSLVAEELSLKKKQEVYSEMCMGVKNYLTPKRIGLFILGGASIVFGLLTAAIVWFSTEMQVAAWSSAMIFTVFGSALLIFMGLTQETAVNFPMKWKRALLYAIAVSVFLFGILNAFIVYYAVTEINPIEIETHAATLSEKNLGFTAAISSLLPFVLSGAPLFIFLCLTEKDRSKPWVLALKKQAAENEVNRFANEKEMERFGLYSGALWILGLSILILLTILVGIKYSWLAIAAAIVGQMLLLASFSKK